MVITTQTKVVQAVYETETSVSKGDRDTFMKIPFWKNGKVRSVEVDKEAVKKATLMSGFFACTTFGLGLTSIEAKSWYGMRDGQEKTFIL